MKRVVVTGATSMVGIALIKECMKRKVEVIAIVRKNSANLNRIPVSHLIKIVECDLDALQTLNWTLQDADVFYHLGWAHTDKEDRKDIDGQLENVEYSVNAVRLAKKIGCRKFVGAGSQAEYGLHQDEKTRPDSALYPREPYGICKLTAGRLCEIEAKRLDLQYSWIRIFSLYGEYELPGTMISTVLHKMLANERCLLTQGIHGWDYLYVSDAGRAFFLAGEADRASGYYCLGSGRKRMIKEYVLEMKEVLGSHSELIFGAVPYDGENQKEICADISALQEDTGWRPEVSFAEGISAEADRIRKKA